MRLIDADELKKRAVKVCFPNAPECGEFDAVVIYEIDIMPTIDPESLRPTAHWISDSAGSTNSTDGKYKCEVYNGFFCKAPEYCKGYSRREEPHDKTATSL